jgi:SAM-dependent methyltransferase
MNCPVLITADEPPARNPPLVMCTWNTRFAAGPLRRWLTGNSGASDRPSTPTPPVRVPLAPLVAVDLGCNEGDLTAALAVALARVYPGPVRVLGVDLDQLLIRRAAHKEVSPQ